jgi:hypothetical protein
MIFDRQLCFVAGSAFTAVTSGVVGDPVDLGTARALDGRQSYIVIENARDATATGSPAITFGLEFSDDAEFTSPVEVPLSLPVLGKADLAAGKILIAPSPLGSKRFVRLVIDSTIALTCAKITAGIVLDPQLNK